MWNRRYFFLRFLSERRHEGRERERETPPSLASRLPLLTRKTRKKGSCSAGLEGRKKKKNGEETTFFRFVNKLFVLCILRLCSWEKWERASLSRTCRRVEVKKQKLQLPCAQPNLCKFAKSNASVR